MRCYEHGLRLPWPNKFWSRWVHAFQIGWARDTLPPPNFHRHLRNLLQRNPANITWQALCSKKTGPNGFKMFRESMRPTMLPNSMDVDLGRIKDGDVPSHWGLENEKTENIWNSESKPFTNHQEKLTKISQTTLELKHTNTRVVDDFRSHDDTAQSSPSLASCLMYYHMLP